MDHRWSIAQVWAAAPDAASKDAASKLANSAAIWLDTGCEQSMVWGSCQGSGKNPYRVMVDTDPPRYKCSCPSRKFPCKHALALLVLWAERRLPSDGGAPSAKPAAAAEWAAKPARGKAAQAEGAPAEGAPGEDAPPAERTEEQIQQLAEQSAAQAAQRAERISAGLAELEQWLTDQLDLGLGRAWNDPNSHFEQAAARMVDAQAPGMARRLRDLIPIAVSGEGWVGRVLEEYALLHLAVMAWSRLDELPDDLAQTVRGVVGLTTAASQVAESPGERGLWLVAGLRDIEVGKLNSRRVWLWSLDPANPRPWASVVTHSPRGQPVDVSLAPGTVVDGLLHRYPGSGNYRGLLSQRYSAVPAAQLAGWQPSACSFASLQQTHRDLLAADPWAEVSPASAQVRTVFRAGNGWRAADEAGDQVPLLGGDLDLWRLHGLLLGGYGQVLGEWSPEGLRPTSLVTTTGLELL